MFISWKNYTFHGKLYNYSGMGTISSAFNGFYENKGLFLTAIILSVCLSICLCLSLSKSPTVTLMMRFLPFLHADFVYRSKVGWLCYQGRVQGLTVFIYKGKRLSQSSTTQKKVKELTVYHVKYPCKELHVIFT